eukprot:SM000026S08979  [mRNA]  locus=s26:851193:852786:+ [translate_table: standard]
MAGHAWACVCAHLDGRDLASLALASRRLHDIAMDDANWRELCLRSLGLDHGNHTYNQHHKEKHIDWMRIGAFTMVSGKVLATDCLKNEVKFVTESNNGDNKSVRDNFKPLSYWLFDDAKPGIWIADLHLIRCPICNVNDCEGTMQTLDVRHAELFLQHEYQSGEWRHTLESEHKVPFQCVQAASGVFDAMYLNTEETRSMLDVHNWTAKDGDWQPRGFTTGHAAAASTRLQPNEGLRVTCEVMRAGRGGQVVGIRISQQLT